MIKREIKWIRMINKIKSNLILIYKWKETKVLWLKIWDSRIKEIKIDLLSLLR
jgi:hypothetical protein